jgi:hypothetical protein
MPSGSIELSGTPAEIAAFQEWRQRRIEAAAQREAGGAPMGDEAPDLTPEDEIALDAAWSELSKKSAQPPFFPPKIK